eukprot:scaffold56684_cov19-Tisochrysis_lutea.AAC.1
MRLHEPPKGPPVGAPPRAKALSLPQLEDRLRPGQHMHVHPHGLRDDLFAEHPQRMRVPLHLAASALTPKARGATVAVLAQGARADREDRSPLTIAICARVGRAKGGQQIRQIGGRQRHGACRVTALEERERAPLTQFVEQQPSVLCIPYRHRTRCQVGVALSRSRLELRHVRHRRQLPRPLAALAPEMEGMGECADQRRPR